MALMAQVSMGFMRKNPENKVTDGVSFCTGLTEQQEKFSKLPYPIKDLSGKNDELQTAAAAAKTGDKTAIKTLENVEDEWKTMFGATAKYVSFEANGDASLITACNFTPTKTERKRKPVPEPLSGMKASPGKGKNTATASSKPQKGNKGYVALAATTDIKVTMNGDTLELEMNGAKAYIKASGKSSVQFQNLQSNIPLCISMFTFNSSGASPLTPGIDVTPQ